MLVVVVVVAVIWWIIGLRFGFLYADFGCVGWFVLLSVVFL